MAIESDRWVRGEARCVLALLVTLLAVLPFRAGAQPRGFVATPGDGEVTLQWADDSHDLTITGYSYSYATSLSAFSSASPPAWHAIPPVEVTIETTGGLDTVGTLEDSEGGVLASNDGGDAGGNFRIRRRLSAGTYHVRVGSQAASSTGAYTLRLTAQVADDHGDARSSATRVALPSETKGRNHQSTTEEDYFRFEVSEPGDVVIWTTGRLDTVGTLEDSEGRELARDDDGGRWSNFSISHSLPAGTYYVGVSSAFAGAYTLRLAVNDHGRTRSSATPVALPSETAGWIGPGTDVDYFRFEISGAREVSIETTGGLDTAGTLEDGDGRELASNDDGGNGANFSIRRSLPAGTYHVRVGSHGSSTGPYRLRLTVESAAGAGDDHGDARSSATRVALPSETAGWIDPRGDVDYFRFDVSGGARDVSIETTGGSDPFGTLEDSEGRELAWDDNSGDGRNFGIYRNLSAGTYYVRVERYGAYTLRVRTEVADDHGDARSSATRVALPSVATLPSVAKGRIHPGTDVDYFRFEVFEDVEVAMGTGGALYTVGTLEDGDGRELASNDDGGGIGRGFQISRSLSAGTYYVRVGSDSSATGGYDFWLRAEHNDPRSATHVELPSETKVQSNGRRRTLYYRFEVSERTSVSIWTTGGDRTVGTLEDSEGRELARDDSENYRGGNFTIRRRLSAGTYFVRVDSGLSPWPGYTLRLAVNAHRDSRESATPVALPSETAGWIDRGADLDYYATDVDYFRFEVSARRVVSIETTGGLDTVGTLEDSGGELLASNDDGGSGTNFSILRSLPAGTYYVRVGSYGSWSTGAYTLRLTADDDGAGDKHGDARSSATRVALPSETAGRIEPGTDVDYFRFEVSEVSRRHVSTAPTHTVTSLANGTRYYFRLRATDRNGDGPAAETTIQLAASPFAAVTISDAVLRRAAELSLGKSVGAAITQLEMATIPGLFATGVADLSGLEHAVNLRGLEIRSGTISDVTPLGALTSLRDLRLHYNQIVDVTPLGALTSLHPIVAA